MITGITAERVTKTEIEISAHKGWLLPASSAAVSLPKAIAGHSWTPPMTSPAIAMPAAGQIGDPAPSICA